jgi:subtilase family serine protease
MHSETQFVSVAATRELRALRHLRFVVWLPVVAALCLAGAASATPMRPATTSVPFSQISSASARAALQTPFCPQVNLVCYSPAHLQQAYDYPTGRKAPTGAGQTIMVVTAFGSPFIQADLAQFDAENGLPDPPSFTIVNQQTIVSANSSNDFFTWAVETSLDVEYAHAMAPGANIVLAVAATDDSKNFAQLEKEALPRFPTAIVTQSFGGDETGEASDPAAAAIMDRLFLNQVQHGGTVVASSGDLGASGFTPFSGPPVPMAGYPAASPFVLSVGGTMGDPFPTGLWSNGHYGGEQAWNELVPFDPGAGAGGGAPSVVYHAPPWQLGLTGSTMRAVPDVSYNAADNGGVIVVLGGLHGVVGGTSAGAPQWAAIIALANDLRGKRGPLGAATPQLWALAHAKNDYRQDFHDITTGSNALFGLGSGFPGFSAGPGYDYATGLGTPDVSNLLKDLSRPDASFSRFDELDQSHGGGKPDKHVTFSAG